MRKLSLLSLVVVLAAFWAAPLAVAHTGGKAEPRIAAKATGSGYSRVVTVKLKDVDNGTPISGASVSVAGQMTSPHTMSLIPHDLPEVGQGTYRGQYPFIMRGDWNINIEVTGKKVETANAELPIRVGGGAPPPPTSGSREIPQPPPLAEPPQLVRRLSPSSRSSC